MLTLEELQACLQQPRETSGKIIVLYGPVKIGKSTTAVQSPKPLLLEAKDRSAETLMEFGQMSRSVPVMALNDWQHSLQVLTSLAAIEHDYKTIVIDGGSGLEEFCDEETILTDCDGDPKDFVSFGKGDRLSAIRWSAMLGVLDKIKQRGIVVFLICHAGNMTVKNPSGSDYIKSVPQLSKGKLSLTSKYADAVLFMDTVVAQKDVNKLTKVGKAEGGETRIMHTRPSAAYEAGNRMNLPDPILLGNSHQEAFAAFRAAVKAGKQEGVKE